MRDSHEPNLSDVAALAGVSPTTVSRVLNNRGYLSQATKDAVAQAIEELNYRPNELARSLLGNRTRVVGVIVPTIAHPFFGEVGAALENALSERGYRALICNSMGRTDKELDYLHQLEGRRVDGLITGAHNESLDEYKTTRLPVVAIDRQISEHIPNVRADNFEGGRLATELLLERGVRRPALVTSSLGPQNLRSEGYLAAVAARGIDPVTVVVPFGTPEPQHSRLLYAELDQIRHRVDGIFVTDDLTACTAAQWARSRGLDVPDELKIIGFDGTHAIRIAAPWLSTIRQPVKEICEVAVDVLISRIESPRGSAEEPLDDSPSSYVLPVSVIESSSTGNAEAVLAPPSPPSIWSD